MTANINPDTLIAYGYISANALDPEVVSDLQDNGTDVYYEEAWSDFIAEKKREWDDTPPSERVEFLAAKVDPSSIPPSENEFDPESYRDEFNDSYQPDEPIHEGELEGVKYRTSWLGGALNVFIFESPFITDAARRASPCVPNAGILDTLDGDVRAYDVPPDWRWVAEYKKG